jgi:hypothetical protein
MFFGTSFGTSFGNHQVILFAGQVWIRLFEASDLLQ